MDVRARLSWAKIFRDEAQRELAAADERGLAHKAPTAYCVLRARATALQTDVDAFTAMARSRGERRGALLEGTDA